MSIVEDVGHEPIDSSIEGAERPLIRRTFAAQVTPGDGRTVDVRLVPFGERIQHNDGLGGVPRGQMYEEEWMPGVFDHQLNAAHRVLANVEHEPGFGGVVGKGVALRAVPNDGYHLELRILDGPDGDKLLQLVPEPLDMVSLEAKPVKSVRSEAGVVQRVKANLMGVAFTRFGAYSGAKVLAVREEAEQLIDEAYLPLDMDPDLLERCRAAGVALPQRYKAHPAETDTPAEAGTSEDGTRQSGEPTSLEDNRNADAD
jgi:HK97 family phage prohead protease